MDAKTKIHFPYVNVSASVGDTEVGDTVLQRSDSTEQSRVTDRRIGR